MRLLIIEDDRDAADYLVKAFREVGHIADQATDGEEGQAMALDGQYDVLIVDRMLPKRDGLSIIHTLRSKSIETPVLILSALGQVDDRVKGLAHRRRRLSGQALRVFRTAGPRRGAGAPAAASAARRRSIASAISSSIGCRTKSAAPGRSCNCSRANSGCSNI